MSLFGEGFAHLDRVLTALWEWFNRLDETQGLGWDQGEVVTLHALMGTQLPLLDAVAIKAILEGPSSISGSDLQWLCRSIVQHAIDRVAAAEATIADIDNGDLCGDLRQQLDLSYELQQVTKVLKPLSNMTELSASKLMEAIEEANVLESRIRHGYWN